MIIVSQDKENIINFERADLINVYKAEKKQVVAWFSCNESEDNNVLLGVYATEERAKEVLKEIVQCYANTEQYKCICNTANAEFLNDLLENAFIYAMPEK